MSGGAQHQAGIRQVAVCVEKWWVMLPVADVGKQQADHTADKGVWEEMKE